MITSSNMSSNESSITPKKRSYSSFPSPGEATGTRTPVRSLILSLPVDLPVAIWFTESSSLEHQITPRRATSAAVERSSSSSSPVFHREASTVSAKSKSESKNCLLKSLSCQDVKPDMTFLDRARSMCGSRAGSVASSLAPADAISHSARDSSAESYSLKRARAGPWKSRGRSTTVRSTRSVSDAGVTCYAP